MYELHTKELWTATGGSIAKSTINFTLQVFGYVHSSKLVTNISGNVWAVSNIRTYRHESPLHTQFFHLLSIQGESEGELTQMTVIVIFDTILFNLIIGHQFLRQWCSFQYGIITELVLNYYCRLFITWNGSGVKWQRKYVYVDNIKESMNEWMNEGMKEGRIERRKDG
jgi:hypothetical protein